MSRTSALTLLLLCLAPVLGATEQYRADVLEKKAISREFFVQGLEFDGPHLYLSAGQYHRSQLVRFNFANLEVESRRKLRGDIFAEGVTVLGDKVYQLTWRKGAMLVYDREALTLSHTLPLKGQGWGLTNNGSELIYSDGSDRLYFLDPENAAILREIAVTEDGRPVAKLNELEWIDGEIWANIWYADRIVIINPQTGVVRASIDLRGLLPASERRANTDVLNGIARDPRDGSIWVTGKYWPWLYRIQPVPAALETSTPPAAKSR